MSNRLKAAEKINNDNGKLLLLRLDSELISPRSGSEVVSTDRVYRPGPRKGIKFHCSLFPAA